ncbi:MAG: hypothetical protein JWO47_849 [Candidatus Saccharibacteria bacterium]|nr:hypothetical protein [Candidatus Saccharibacteria bacterium]
MAMPQKGKRLLIDRTQAIMLGFVVGASVITMFSLVASKSYFTQANYLNKLAGKKEKAVKQLKSNKDAVSKLVASYKDFASKNPNLIGGANAGKDERDGDNGRLVLDALPSKYDFPALATSLEKLLNGYTINTISGSDDSTNQTDTAATPVAIPFTLDVTSDYAGIQKLSSTFEKSIRPFQILSIKLNGTNAILQSTITAQTFYQPEKNLKIGSEVVK